MFSLLKLETTGVLELMNYSLSKVIEELQNYYKNSKIEFDILTPNKDSDKKITLSKNYGLGGFPFHTDGSHKVIPPKYIILKYNGNKSSNCDTLIYSLYEMMLDRVLVNDINKNIYIVKGSRVSFYSSIFTIYGDKYFCRWNPLTMQNTLNTMFDFNNNIKKNNVKKIQWVENKIVVINNWNSLHARESVNLSETTRMLERYSIYI